MIAVLTAMVTLFAPVDLVGEEGAKPKILVLDLSNGAELSDTKMEALSDAIVTAISGAPVEVLSALDLRRTMEQKQALVALGCTRDDCLLDLASAWSARYLLAGSLAAFKGRMILNLKLIDARGGALKVLLRETQEAEPETITALARISAAKVRQALGGPPPTDEELAVLKAAKVPLVGLSVGGISLAVVAYALLVDRLGAVAFAEQAQAVAADPVLGPHLADQSAASAARSNLLLVGASVGFGSAAWLWWKGW